MSKITTYNPPPPSSSLSTLISSSTPNLPSSPLSAPTLQTLHNLQHQHLWTSLQIHQLPTTPSPKQSQSTPDTDTDSESGSNCIFLVSGIPPNRIYTHPDEQLYMLERGLRENDITPARMFVLPTVQGQSWSLRDMAGVFDGIPEVDEEVEAEAGKDVSEEKAEKLVEYYEYRKKAYETKEWGAKRLLLAMVDKGMGGEGTVVYYVVQEGAVKPRQN